MKKNNDACLPSLLMMDIQKLYRCVLVLCLLTISGTNSASPPLLKFKVLGQEQGISNSFVRCFLQDSRGFLWIGTKYGLNRYDGNTIVTYFSDLKPGTLSHSSVYSIAEDKDSAIWIGTNSGLNRFDRKSNSFERFSFDPNGRGTISDNVVTALLVDRKGALLVGNQNGVDIRERGKKIFKALNPRLKGFFINCIYQSPSGHVWVGTQGGGLFEFDEGYQLLQVIKKSPQGITSNLVSAVGEDGNKDLWIGTADEGVFLYKRRDGTFRQYRHVPADKTTLSGNVVKSVLTDNKGRVWIGVENGGMNLYDPVAGNFMRYVSNPADPFSLSQQTACTIYEDREHNLWVGTNGGGVCLYSEVLNKFGQIYNRRGMEGLSGEDVKTFCEVAPDIVWIGTDGGGINVWNRKQNTIRTYRYRPGDPSSLGSDAVLHIYKDKQGTVWVGTWGGGLNRYNPYTNSFTRFVHKPGDPASISSNNVCRIFEDSRNNLWLATHQGGLQIFDRAAGAFKKIETTPGNKISIEGKIITCINEDRQGNIWIGSADKGLYRYHTSGKYLTSYFKYDSKDPDVFKGLVQVLFNDSKGRLWAGQNGLWMFNFDTGRFMPAGRNELFNGKVIMDISEAANGDLWIATNNGLIRYNPSTYRYKQYTEADGLQGREFSRSASLLSFRGELFFGGLKGFNVFFPDSVIDNYSMPPVYFTDFQVFNKSVAGNGRAFSGQISEAKEVMLGYDQSVFSVEYASINLTNPEQTRYAYKLEGFDQGWNHVGNQLKATYTNLNPGEYLFSVKAANGDGVWNTPACLRVVIVPPFWMTWWFRVLSLAFAGALMLFIVNKKKQSDIRKLEAHKKEEIHQSQLQFFTNISHELRTPLTMILGPLDKLMKEEPASSLQHTYRVMHRNASRLMNLIGEIIDFRRLASGHLTLKVAKENLGLLIRDIASDFSDRAAATDISFHIQVEESSRETWFDKDFIEKIVSNLLDNAFKYTGAGGTVTIATFSNPNTFRPSFSNELILKSDFISGNRMFIRVADSGIGISRDSIGHLFERYFRVSSSAPGSGLGLAFVRSLTFLHKGDIYVYSEEKKGTEIVISIPCGKEDFQGSEIKDSKVDEGSSRLQGLRYVKEPSAPDSIPGNTESNKRTERAPEKHHILIVDDNADLRAFLRESLEPEYEVMEAGNGAEGLAAVKDKSPQLVISDVVMPVMDGIRFCRLLKDDMEISHIPVILLTAKGAMETKITGIGSGADHYFSKPVNMDLLLLTIRNMFEQRKKLKERYSKDYKAEARELVHASKDREFMDRVLAFIESRIEDTDLHVEQLAKEVGMSQTKLLKKIKDITGQTINEFIRGIRLKKAVDIMVHEDVLVTEVIYRVGIQSHSYFTSIFKKEYGKTPTQFLLEIKEKM